MEHSSACSALLETGKIQQANPTSCSNEQQVVSLAPLALTEKFWHEFLQFRAKQTVSGKPLSLKNANFLLISRNRVKYYYLTPSLLRRDLYPFEALLGAGEWVRRQDSSRFAGKWRSISHQLTRAHTAAGCAYRHELAPIPPLLLMCVLKLVSLG